MSKPIKLVNPPLVIVKYQNYTENEQPHTIIDLENFWQKLSKTSDFISITFKLDNPQATKNKKTNS